MHVPDLLKCICYWPQACLQLFPYHRRSFPLLERGLPKPSALCGQPQVDPMILPQLILLFGESLFKAVLISLMPAVSDKVFGLVFLVGAPFALLNVPGVYPALVLGVQYQHWYWVCSTLLDKEKQSMCFQNRLEIKNKMKRSEQN